MNIQCLPEAIEAAPLPRRKTVGVNVGGVMVGGGAPIVVQSMTNTDTADVEVDGAAGRRARPRRLGAGPHHRRPRRGGGGRAAYPRPARQDAGEGAAHRRLPLHRPQAARRSSGLRRGARQIPHQSRQCRLPREARPAVRLHHRDGDQIRQAGAHRRELGLARPGAPDEPDGRRTPSRPSRSRPAR